MCVDDSVGGDAFIGGEEGEDGRDVVMGAVLRRLVAAVGAGERRRLNSVDLGDL